MLMDFPLGSTPKRALQPESTNPALERMDLPTRLRKWEFAIPYPPLKSRAKHWFCANENTLSVKHIVALDRSRRLPLFESTCLENKKHTEKPSLKTHFSFHLWTFSPLKK